MGWISSNLEIILNRSEFFSSSRISRILVAPVEGGLWRTPKKRFWLQILRRIRLSHFWSATGRDNRLRARIRLILVVKMEIILISYRICTICISIDWKFSSEFNGVHLEVIRGHLRGQKRSFWGQKSEIWSNAHDMHIDRLEIFFWIHWCVSRGHPRSSKGSNKVILGSKVRNMAKYTWNAYESIQNFILILMAWISSSFTLIKRVKRVILGLKHLNHDKINKMNMSNDRYWIRYWIHNEFARHIVYLN